MTLVGRILGALLICSVFVVFEARADPPVSSCTQTNLTQVSADCSLTGTETSGLIAGSGPNGDGHIYTVNPQCGHDEQGGAICHGGAPCFSDDGQPGWIMDLYRDGVLYGETCLSDTQADSLNVITPGMVLRQFRAIDWPESPLTIEPPGLKTAVNLATYYYTDNKGPSTQTVRILGQAVEIEATPASYVYHFDGDDAAQTDSSGGPYPRGDVTHTYLYQGTATPSLDTVYAGRYRINDGGWVEIPETLTVDGSPVTLDIIEVRPTLVAPAHP